MNNKNQTLLLNLLISCISAKCSPEMSSLNNEYTLALLNFLMVCLCNCFADCWFLETVSEAIPVPE